jgi:heme exporter protein A
MLTATGLARAYGGRRAVDGVDLALEAGQALAIFGPNGAGKTTLLRLLAGLLRPTAGTVAINGQPVRGDTGARGHVGYISHASMMYPTLTALENVEFAAQLHGVPDARDAARRALALMRVEDRAGTQVRALSRGLQQRVSIARAVVHGPGVVLLDEPYTGLDTLGAAALTDMLGTLRSAGATLVMVTHHVSEGLELATTAAIMLAGRIVRQQPASGLDVAVYARQYREQVLQAAGMAPAPVPAPMPAEGA